MRNFGGVLVLAAAVVVFLGGIVVGVNLLFSSADVVAQTETCEVREVAEGEEITADMVTVNVFNSSNTAGLANRVSINLAERGFTAGQVGNNSGAVEPNVVTILTDNQEDPAVQLVAQQFNGEVQFQAPDIEVDEGVIVLLGPNYGDLRGDAPATIAAAQATSICVPVLDVEIEELPEETEAEPAEGT